MPIAQTAQDIINQIICEENPDSIVELSEPISDDDMEIWKEVEFELQKSIYQELITPIENRTVDWAQTLVDSS